MLTDSSHTQQHRAFTMIEMVAVVVIISVMLAVVGIAFVNGQPSLKIKTDAGKTVSFLRNMWDRTRTTGDPLILDPDFDKGTLSYFDPRDNRNYKAEFESGAQIIGIKLNDRLYSAQSSYMTDEDNLYGDAYLDTSIYISEGRGLALVAVIFGIFDEDEEKYEYLTACTLNLITGKGFVETLSQDELANLLDAIYDQDGNGGGYSGADGERQARENDDSDDAVALFRGEDDD